MSTLLRLRRPRPGARVRLFCIPYAGSSAAVYRTWPELFGEGIEVCPVELPGRGSCMGEPPASDLAALRGRLLDELSPLLDLPVALFGHSLGAKLAFELSKAIGPRVVRVFASASIAPDVPARDPIAELPRDTLLLRLRRMGGAPERVLDDAELMEMLLPVVRADLRAAERYRVTDAVRAPSGVTVFAGTRDAQVPLEDARRWEAFSGGAFRFVTFDAGHFFLAGSAPTLAAEITRDLEEAARAPAAEEGRRDGDAR
jgi:medium-chain acyl-[acyl-carrier-protein] hydrolase